VGRLANVVATTRQLEVDVDEMIAQCMQMMSQMNGMMGGNMMGGMMGGNAAMMAGWASPWYWLGWILALAVLTFLITAVVRMIRAARHPAGGPETPLAILQRRLARGEVSTEQFEAIKRQLT
jgi:uncharacterized membrane protein